MQINDIEQALSETVSLLDKLRMAIYRGEFPPGQRLVESEEAIEILEVRGLIEGLCAARAALQATEDDRRELRRLADAMTDAVKHGDVRTDSQLSDQIHTRLREIAGQQTAAGIIDRLRHQGVRYQFHVSLLPGRLAQGAKEHLDIIDAVVSGDPVAAERITREHFASVVGCLHQLEDVALPSILPAV